MPWEKIPLDAGYPDIRMLQEIYLLAIASFYEEDSMSPEIYLFDAFVQRSLERSSGLECGYFGRTDLQRFAIPRITPDACSTFANRESAESG